MASRQSPYPKAWLFAGGAAFGLYFTAGLAYFETFRKWHEFTVIHYLAVAMILVPTSIVLAFSLFGAPSAKLPNSPLVRWFLLPSMAFLLAGFLIYLYFGMWDPMNFRTDILLPSIVRNMVLLGLLPVQVALVLVPQPAVVKAVVIAQPVERISPPDSDPQQSLQSDNAALAQSVAPVMFTVEASAGESQFKIPLADLLMVEAADNYCKFYYLKDGLPKTRLLRMKMKEAEEALQGAADFHRCHRSFLVNGSMVSEVLGNSQAYRLKMKHLEEQVPVSRTFDVGVLRAVFKD